MTATPALQTTEIFGQPVFKYTYREAVIEGYLAVSYTHLDVYKRQFPDTWTFGKRKTVACRMIGNAFPPPVAQAVGEELSLIHI